MTALLPAVRIAVTVYGLPVGQGSVRSLGAGRPSIHANAATLKPWRAAVVAALVEQTGGRCLYPKGVPVAVRLWFTLPRPKSAPRRVTRPCTRPDIDHYVRAAFDAITQSGCWFDDGQAVDLVTSKSFPSPFGLQVPGLRLVLEATA